MDEVKIARIILPIFFIIGVIYSGFAVIRVSHHHEKTVDLPASIAYVSDKTGVYTYTFNGLSYNGTKTFKEIPNIGDEIEIKINPEKPFSNELKETADLSSLEILVLIITITTFVLGLILILDIKGSLSELCDRSLGETLLRLFLR